MYLGMVIALVGIAVLCQGSLVSFGLVLAFFAVLDRWYVEYEETMMEKVFGQRYSDYCRTTRRWI